MAARPVEIKLHKRSKTLELVYAGNQRYVLSAEYLRVHSPSAEVRGHGRGQEKLQTGKIHVGINGMEPSGQYAVKIVFDDGHDSGLFTWDYLHELCTHQAEYWQQYLHKLEQAKASRDPHESVVKLMG
ncbi:1-(5-phosphoribosyl)-5-[(5-phosphoribosylamino)methylideneamino] imidazole-4-carboxamide isomerase [Pokkaliibacter plantistimulans]|uniref:1-(5-phosphoribosyl)-5-[(5-phosphoribosylamino)methylideneamino] imidazole-4-carboxamide isomerase n=1 Tax=Pokkaliibacter plantistimulans TaxID=1635171 RepID=A0ABX5LZN0_9GAMM|nr:DUF971 domain-containing protein [Pokkaliibacter plantistimulans]PXF32107.1 1-(5-phosphoribosyl)-5-[(5-phosphoribosylamino)methylideneamino] imidazole-4-carboxamide isomerase [Pokkaliibacter plantistimulans]